MKKAKIVAALVPLMVVGALTGCNKKLTDSTKTQLYVLNYQGGYGKKWLEAAASRFEALNADKSYESGKKGIQVVIKEEKTTPQNANIKSGKNEVIIFENMKYESLVNDNVCADITKYITEANQFETSKTIESKLYDDQKNFFNMGGKYYAVPHYVGSMGIVYNRKVFRDNLFYFADDYEDYAVGNEARFAADLNHLSVGPDGVAGTFDDGLPVTYEEFYELCDYIDGASMTPLIWLGKGDYNYLGSEIAAMTANFDGVADYRANYTMDGSFEAMVLNAAGTDVTYDSYGKPVTERVTVHPEKVGGKYDGYEIQRSASKYYAMSFMENIVHHKGTWAYDRLNDSLLHTDAQRYFIKSQFGTLPSNKDAKKNRPIAMIFEGNWWESEASEVFSTLTDAQKAELDYGWMPLPRSEFATSTRPTTLSDLDAMMFVKAGLSEMKTDLAATFIQYLNTDEALTEFTTTTSAIKALKYDIGEKREELTSFGKAFWDYYHNSDVIFPNSHNQQFVKALSDQQLSRRYFTNERMSWPSEEFESNPSETAGTYLAKMYKYYKDSIWSLL